MNIYHITPENVRNIRAELQVSLYDARFLVAITGAGISKASGIPLLEETIQGVPIRSLFQQRLLETNPDLYYNLYKQALTSWRFARPNSAHTVLARKKVWVITQNVDGLHRDAGTEHLIELHGNFRELTCHECQRTYNSSLAIQTVVPHCPHCASILKPGIVLEGQEVRHFSRAVDWVGRAEVLFVIGTNLSMVPVKILPTITERNGGVVIWINSHAEQLVPYLYED